MNIRRFSLRLAFALSASGLCLAPASARAQVVGENVNMVSGIGWPGGDPFLQRQNEPTLAVSSVNPMHLMAGANDYRAVDIKVPDGDVLKINGDAWLGVFKSLDGGQNWKSVLLPGYPQDPGCKVALAPVPAGHVHHARCGHNTASPSVGGLYALCGLPAAADPVMRAGTDGMMFLAGINFQRDKQKSRVFLARYIDLNNKENGTPKGDSIKDTDPLRYVDTRIIADSPPNVFIDKPWMAVDVPRAGAGYCEIPVSDDPTVPPRRFLGGTIYVSWAEFTLPDDQPTTTSTIKFTYSTDCGKSWVTPYALNSKNSVLNQGVALAVEPINGRVYAAWRRIGTPTNKQTDAIMATRSGGRQRNFSSPRVVSTLTMPFEQGSSYTSFRTEAYPVMAISTDGTNSWAHVAWQQRKGTGVYESRIVMSSAKVHPPPAGESDPDDPEELDAETRLQWSAPRMVDDAPTVGDDTTTVFSSGHQVMPALTFGQGKLMLVYYDTRFDHARRYYTPLAAPSPDGKFYKEMLAPLGELSPKASPKAPVSAVFNSWLNDGSLGYVRHTVDVRVASAPAGGNPTFTSVLASKFPFGVRGDEGYYSKTGLKVPGFGTNEIEIVKGEGTTAAGAPVPSELKALQQLQANPPNYPLFKNGGVAFMGDYIDIQGPAFVPTAKGGWAFNTAATAAPVFHAVWTSNQDVQVPRAVDANGFPDWSLYAPPFCPGCNAPEASRYANDGTLALKCDPSAGAEASRDQNIYTARITEGLLVATPQNMKPLDQTTRAFVIVAQNTTNKDMMVSFAADVPAQGATQTVPSINYSFTNDFGAKRATGLTSVVVPARSYVSRSLFVALKDATTNPLTTLNVSVTETGCTTTCRSGYLTLNPASALGSLRQPDAAGHVTDISLGDATGSKMADAGLTDPSRSGDPTAPSWTNPAPMPSWTNTSWTDPSWTNPSWTNPSWTNPALTNSNFAAPSWTNPSWTNPSWTNPSWTNPSWTNPSWTNPSWTNPSWTNPSWTNPSWTNPSWTNPSWTNPSWTNSSMSDLSYTITNTGNTTTSYHVRVVGAASASTPTIGLAMAKWYNTPASVNCNLIEVPRYLPVVEVPNMALTRPGDPVDPDPTNGSASNATIALAPGESALISLRANVTLEQMAALGSTIGVAAVPATFIPDGTTYQDLPRTSPGTTVGIGAPTTTTLTYDSTAAVATVTVTGGTPGPTGTIGIILNGKQMAARWPIDATGTATVDFRPAPAVGDTLAAFYPGDATHKASTSGSIAVAAGVPLSVGVRAANTYVQIWIREVASGAMVDGAAVQFNGTAVPPMGNGYYYLTFDGGSIPWASGGMPIDIRITNTPGNHSVRVTGNYPQQPVITSPANYATVLTLAPLTVSWTGSADYYAIIAYCDPTSEVNYVCAGGSQQVNAPTTTFTYPANMLTAGTQAQVFVLAVNNLTFTGATQMGSSFAELPTMIYLEPVGGPSPTMAFPRFAFALGTDGTSKLYAVGGMQDYAYVSPVRAVEVYDIPSGLWTPVNWIAVPNFFAAGVQVGTGLRLLGGQSLASMGSANTWYGEYNWYFNRWQSYTGMTVPRTMAAAAELPYVENAPLEPIWMISGGYDGTAPTNSAETMNGYSQWTVVAPMNTARMDHSAALVGSRFYAIGGKDASATPIASVEYYEKSTNRWTVAPSLPIPLAGSAAVGIGSRLFVMGGATTGLTVSRRVFMLDTATTSWVEYPPLAVAVANPAAAVVGGLIYVVGGDQGSGPGAYGSVQTVTP